MAENDPKDQRVALFRSKNRLLNILGNEKKNILNEKVAVGPKELDYNLEQYGT